MRAPCVIALAMGVLSELNVPEEVIVQYALGLDGSSHVLVRCVLNMRWACAKAASRLPS